MMLENVFDTERPRLAAIGVRILGSADEAEDVLQEAWLRLSRADHDEIDVVPAWLTTVVTRLCLDHLRTRGTRSNAEFSAPNASAPVDPEADAVLAARVGEAMHVVMDTLAPAERVAFVLHDIFGYTFDEISSFLGRSDTAVRQLASRARRKVHGATDSADERADREEHHRVVEAFLAAARGGELATMLSLLAPGAFMRPDAIGVQMGTEPVYDGAAAVAERFNGAKGALPATIDGDLGAAWIAAGEVKVAFVFHVDAGVVSEVELIADPDVLATMTITRRRGTSS